MKKDNKKLIFLIVTLIILLIIFVIELISFGILKVNSGKYLEESNKINKDNDVIDKEDNVKEDDSKKYIYYKVFFNEDNGNELKSVEVKENEKLELYIPSKEGYGFTGWTLNDIVIDNNYKVTNDIMLKANWVKQDVDYNSVHVWTNNKGKMKVKVDQINIRESASVSSKDIGDVYNGEIYEVYDIVEDYNYVWYKIKKNNIEGYVADKKGNNYNEYKYTEWTDFTKAVDNVVVGKLDVDEVFIENLVLPVISAEYNCNTLGYSGYLSENNTDEELIYLSFIHYKKLYYSDNYSNIIRKDNEYFVSFDKLNYYYQRIFGKVKSLTPTNIRQYTNCGADMCINCDDTNSKEIKYDENAKGYWLFEGACGAACGPYKITLYTDILSAKQVNDEIIVEYNIYDLHNYYGNQNKVEVKIIPENNKKNISLICNNTDNYLCSKEEVMKIRNEYRSQLPIYEATFKKQSDGKYYYVSGVWKE